MLNFTQCSPVGWTVQAQPQPIWHWICFGMLPLTSLAWHVMTTMYVVLQPNVRAVTIDQHCDCAGS